MCGAQKKEHANCSSKQKFGVKTSQEQLVEERGSARFLSVASNVESGVRARGAKKRPRVDESSSTGAPQNEARKEEVSCLKHRRKSSRHVEGVV